MVSLYNRKIEQSEQHVLFAKPWLIREYEEIMVLIHFHCILLNESKNSRTGKIRIYKCKK